MKVEKIHDKKIIVYISFTDLKERNIDKNEFHHQNSRSNLYF